MRYFLIFFHKDMLVEQKFKIIVVRSVTNLEPPDKIVKKKPFYRDPV